ncbi:CDP-glycerol glycerophosphotransferase family protein [Rhodohalobacter sulfatireducens]|uniref:CDP-glycerol glycerophosphotransferase family protein n=1 Tax=Rhodohalobacter sulfatireducens TaxID=2911366 RepID=A0ABS9KIV0_9BACT|nr:CDP-glycerol glycerophosphotransferase family protein [Rhodohalobacter sulfatireducens]MCG2590784.1 CDP-glycerol glycerophosphotransferase family protein [Rhodohalobacter sulfatireducens]
MIKRIIGKIIPKRIKLFINKNKFFAKIAYFNYRYSKIAHRLKEKENINVALLLLNTDTWKYDDLYWDLEGDNRFNPIVVICPLTGKGSNYLKEDFEQSIKFCGKKNYQFLEGYDLANGKVIDIKKSFKPDIVFYSNPNNLTFPEFKMSHFKDCLNCYVPYSFRVDTLFKYTYKKPFVNLTWRNYYETRVHKELAETHAPNKGVNIRVVGFPKLDEIKKTKNKACITDEKDKKTIIWAPHWTIKDHQNTGLNWSCFLQYHEVFLNIARIFKDRLQIVMKPHPFLFNLLEQENVWGKKRTYDYIEKWEKSSNLNIVHGDYIDLFCSSDALMHDSGSFLAEYLILDKPVAYTVSDEDDLDTRFNEFGELALKQHKLIYEEEGLYNFIESVLNDNDTKKNTRKEFIEQYLNINQKTASENIIADLKNNLS